MSHTLRFTTAESLVLEPPPEGLRGAEGLRGGGPVAVLADLGHDSVAVAESKLDTLARSLGPTLYLHGDTILLCVTGPLAPGRAARRFAGGLDPALRQNLQMGTVLGEDLTDQIEELTRAGHALREGSTQTRLVDEPKPPVSVLSGCGSAPILKAISAGAGVVFCHGAPMGSLGIAAAREVFSWNENDYHHLAGAAIAAEQARKATTELYADSVRVGGVRPIGWTHLPEVSYRIGAALVPTLRFDSIEAQPPGRFAAVDAYLPDGYVVDFTLHTIDTEVSAELIDRLAGVCKGARLALQTLDNLVVGRLDAPDRATLAEEASRLELACGPLEVSLHEPLHGKIREKHRVVRSELPREVLGFDCQVRPCNDWID